MTGRVRRKGDDGAAAVEFAFVSIVLLMLLYGILAFGLYFYSRQSAIAAAREGARLATVGVTDCGQWKAIVVSRGTGATIKDDDVTLDFSGPTGDANGNGKIDTGDTLRISVTYKTLGPARELLKIATALLPGTPSDIGDGATMKAVARAEQAGLRCA